jgi:protein TonB
LWTAVVVTLLISFSGFWLLQQVGAKKVVPMWETKEIVLSSIEEIKTPPPPPPPEPEKQVAKKPGKAIRSVITTQGIVSSEIKRTKFTTPIVTDKVNSEPLRTPDEDAVIDNINVEGVVGHQNLAPASSTAGVFETGKGTGVAEVLTKPKEDKNKVFEKVEIQASVNIAKWRQHLEQNLVGYINDAANAGMQSGTYNVTVRFLVERDGSINDVSALNDPGFGLAQGATQVIKSGPKWNPGEQNGIKVRSYHTQQITFVIMDS